MSASILLFILLLPFAGSFAAVFLRANARNAEAWLAGTVALCGLIAAGYVYPTIAAGEIIRYHADWLPGQGLDFSLRMDGFAWMFTMLVCGIGLLVVLYARYYMSANDPVPRFFSFLLGFMGSMLGIVLSGNLIQMVFFWELTSLFSFLLIGYWHHNAKARDGARIALTVTGTGGLCLFVGVLLLGHIVGSYDLDVVLAAGAEIRNHSLYLPTLILILLGALTKSAQFPFHFWLPQAMAAPTPVSAYLHSATMVKAGVFLLARLWPVLSGTDAWFWIVGSIGLFTFLFAAFCAMFQQDLKGILAYSTISHLGLITLLLGLDTPLATVAAIFHMMNHATFKASLFMAAGIIDHETGTRDLRRLSGLYRFMPITATLAMVAAASMAGVPLLNGFLSKEMFFAETIALHKDSLLDTALPYIATLAGAFSVIYSLRFIRDVFFGPTATDLPRPPHEPPRWMLLPIAILVLGCLIVGMVPSRTIGPFLNTAVTAVLGPATPVYSLTVWHGVTLPLFMSVLALAGGVAGYFALRRHLAHMENPPWFGHLSSQGLFDRLMVFLSWRMAKSGEHWLGTQRLQPQLRLLVCAGLVAGILPFMNMTLFKQPPTLQGIDWAFLLVWVVGIACALGAARQAKYHRLAALMLMGGAGLATSITFVWFSAPDLALTQLLVEIVTTVLILLGLRWLPKRFESMKPSARRPAKTQARRLLDLLIALTVGVCVAILAFAVMTRPPPDSISSWFLDLAYTEGGGKNVVNVILVDFRAFDTLGEITVLGIVALTVFALLRRFRPAPDNADRPHQQLVQQSQDDQRSDGRKNAMLVDTMLVPALIMRLLFPVIATLAIYLFMRGHDLPGGGFVAGLTLSIGVILQYMAGGTRWVEARLAIHPARWMGLGLLFAVATGMGAWLFGYPFLTTAFTYVELPLFGKIPLATALIFDLGVFTLVVGATVLLLIALAHQSIRSHRPTKIDIPVYEHEREH